MRPNEITIVLLLAAVLIGCKADMQPANDGTTTRQNQAVSHTTFKPTFESVKDEVAEVHSPAASETTEPTPAPAPAEEKPQKPIEVDTDTLLMLKSLAHTWGVKVEKEQAKNEASKAGN